jgi:hypothetical protein
MTAIRGDRNLAAQPFAEFIQVTSLKAFSSGPPGAKPGHYAPGILK